MTRSLRVMHIASGDLWAGAEAQAFTLMAHLKRMPETDVAAVLMNGGTLAERLQSAGVSVYILNEQQSGAITIFGALRGVLRSWRPDIVHTHREKENILGSLAIRSCLTVPSVRTVHGAKEHARAAGWKGVRRCTVSRIDRWCGQHLQQRVIAVTRELGAKMRNEFPEKKIVVIENGVDSEEVKRGVGKAAFRIAEPNAAHIGIVGRLVEVKRVDLFIEAAALLLQGQPERQWRFHIFGEGPCRSNLEMLSRRLHVGDKVMFHGHRQDIATCISGLDALVICSDHEGMPMTSLEAAVLGIPTVAHAVGGLVEVVPEEFLVSRHDASGYRDGILRALRADGRSIAVKRADSVLIQFSAQRNAERVRALYEQVLAESHHA